MSASTGTTSTANTVSGPNTTGNVTGNPDTAAPGVGFGAAGIAPGIGGAGGTNAHGQSIGDKIRGGVDVIHGAGEAIRGSINKTADDAGEGIAGRSSSGIAPPPKRTDGGESSGNVAQSGMDELKRGLDAFKKA